jgi:hypothetical protein
VCGRCKGSALCLHTCVLRGSKILAPWPVLDGQARVQAKSKNLIDKILK